ncbi:Leucine aminopeptidase 1 [Madurella mycetomatis]|uniref:Peptide hydrolase n=1 Tax=Madurella mycetomatis TaxID=100816 RepID=A0A175WBJ8_9PEZI|nr:Leucine aminopeptidase 1 [Madurella mycetomatis]
MQGQTFLVLLASLAWSVAAAPAIESTEKAAGLHLIKISPEDPGKWVTDEQKIREYTAKNIGFVDVTDINDVQVLAALSAPDSHEESLSVQAVTYPSSVSHATEVNPLLESVSNANPQSWLQTLTDFHNRHYNSSYGTEAGTWLFDVVKSVAAANPAITVAQFKHDSFDQPSIIAQIPGTSSNLVIVSAHYDSTGGNPTARGPGADDNGSGVVAILEALRVLANAGGFQPRDTLEFHFYGGEEGGMLGSLEVFASYKAAGRTVLALVNQDMAGYSPSGKISIFTDHVNSALTAYARVVAEAYVGETTSGKCGYGCSDHQSAMVHGFPAAYVCDEPVRTSSPYIHSSRDTYETIMWDAVLRHSQFTVAFLVEASYL